MYKLTSVFIADAQLCLILIQLDKYPINVFNAKQQ